MLVQFLAENFLSFKDEAVFSMRAPATETRGVVEIPGHEGLRGMRAAALYGANGSGKSNLVEAFRVGAALVAHGMSDNGTLPASPFRLAANTLSRASRFQFDFVAGDVRFSYVLGFTAKEVTGESLYRVLPGVGDEELIYEREAQLGGGAHSVEFGPMLLEGEQEQQQFARFVAKATPVWQPLLTEFAKRNVEGFAPILAWFREGLVTIGASDSYRNLVHELLKDESLREFYARMLSQMGTGVDAVKVLAERDPRVEEFLLDFDTATREPKSKVIIHSLMRLVPDIDGLAVAREGANVNLLRLMLEHRARNGTSVDFAISEESDGTRRLLHLLPVLFHRTKGPCTVIDELDRSLHTSLTRRFVEEFLSMASGASSQLIFTTHDTNLLNGRLLPPGSIWFVEKDDDGVSHLHSLAEYRAEQLDTLMEHLEEGYLQGRFGAIPFLAPLGGIGWHSEEAAG